MDIDDITNDSVIATWMGFSTGGYMGRDDGYPELKCLVAESLKEAVRCSKVGVPVHYFKLVPVLQEEANVALAAVEQDKKDQERTHLNEKIGRLMAERDELEKE